MAENQSEQDRSEPASPFKLKQARQRGQVAKSMEVNSFFIVAAGAVLFAFFGAATADALLQVFVKIFSLSSSFDGSEAGSNALFATSLSALSSVLWPLVFVVILASVCANLVQTGPIFSFYPLKPDIKRLNPIAGFKRLFSKKMLFEALKTLIKMLIFATLISLTLASVIPMLFELFQISPSLFPQVISEHSLGLLFKLLAAMAVIALLDFLYVRWDFAKRMRMSRRELKEEYKRHEGDPLIKRKRRELLKENTQRAASLAKVPQADVVITNPTHLSIALVYERERMGAPIISAMGAGEMALKIREIARANRVAVVQNKSLARALYRRAVIDGPIPKELFPSVARILAWVYLQRKMRRSLHEKTAVPQYE